MSQPPAVNPYQAPAAIDLPQAPSTTAMYFRDGNLLVVRDGAELPHRCVLTNEPLGPGDWRKRKLFTWAPPWIYVLILVNLIVLLIVLACVQKKARVTFSMSPAIARRYATRGWLAALGILGGIGGIVAGAAMDQGSSQGVAIFGGILLLLTGLVFCTLLRPLKVKGFRDGWFQIKGCHPDYLDLIGR